MISLYEFFLLENLIIYDKSSYHPNSNHIRQVLNWANNNNLLTKEGIEIYSLSSDNDLVLHSRMFNKYGNKLMIKNYDNFLNNIDYKKNPDITILNKR